MGNGNTTISALARRLAALLVVSALVGCATQNESLNRVIVEGSKGEAVIIGPHLPIGTVIAYAGSMSEIKQAALTGQGWLLCDGGEVERKLYQELFDVIGGAYGEGDARITFSLPDYRGHFLRGVSGSSQRDPGASARTAPGRGGNFGNVVGSVQTSAAGPHEHGEIGVFDSPAENVVIGLVDPRPGMTQTQQALTPGEGREETRPINTYVHYLIFSGTTAL